MEKRPPATIKEVAKRARVSVGTVSNVIRGSATVSPKLRARVERIVSELNYHPNHIARSLKSQRTHLLGMVISDISNPFFPLVVRGAEDAALRHDYLLTVFNTDDRLDREQQIFGAFRARRFDGALVVVSPLSTQGTHLQETLQSGFPLVCLDRVPPGVPVDAVLVDSFKGARMCVNHLIAMGHRDIGMIAGAPGLQTSADRYQGYVRALSDAGLPLRSELVREGDFRQDSGYRMAKDLLLHPPLPTALLAANGTMGLGALKAIQELGLRCPEEIALAVYDDVPGSEVFRPRLTVVSQPAYELGYKAADLLIRRLSGELSTAERVVLTLDPELIIRESTGVRREALPAGA